MFHYTEADPGLISQHGLLQDPRSVDPRAEGHGFGMAEPGVYMAPEEHMGDWSGDYGTHFRIDTSQLDPSLFEPDPNPGGRGAWRYRGDVPPHALEDWGPLGEREARVATMTLPQEQRAWMNLAPAPSSWEPVHTWDDGWHIRDNKTAEGVNRVGEFMRNCWQGVEPDDLRTGPYLGYGSNPRVLPNARFFSIHDEHGIPRGAFYANEENVVEPLGARNNLVAPEAAGRLADWAQASGRMMGQGRDWHADQMRHPDEWLDANNEDWEDRRSA